MAMPKHEPSVKLRAEARAYAIVGTPHHDIAKLMGVGIKQLLRYYAHELAEGKAAANVKIAKRLYAIATDDKHPKQVACIIFWLKAQAGWREVHVLEVGNKPGESFKTKSLGKVDPLKAARAYKELMG